MFVNRKLAATVIGIATLPTATWLPTGLISAAEASSKTQNLTVSATVNTNCNFPGSATDVAFGTYDPVSANLTTPLDAAGNFYLSCTKGGSAVMSVSLGAQASGAQRRMIASGNYLNYDIYSDTGRTTAWNMTTTVNASFATTSNKQQFFVYGRIPAGQDVATGSYADTITVTATY